VLLGVTQAVASHVQNNPPQNSSTSTLLVDDTLIDISHHEFFVESDVAFVYAPSRGREVRAPEFAHVYVDSGSDPAATP